MKVAYSGRQLTFEEMKGSLSCLPKDNQWVRLGDSLPWDGFDKLYLRKLRNGGREAKNLPSRMIIGAPVIKHKTRHTDIKVDATCADAEVKYPTDCGLLDDSARFIGRMLRKACKFLHIAVPRNSCSLIHAKYIRLTKLRHKGKKAKEAKVVHGGRNTKQKTKFLLLFPSRLPSAKPM